MKTKGLFSITIKIIGLLALWKAVQTFGFMINGIGIFSSLFANNDYVDFSFMITIGLALILKFFLPLIVALLLLFRTEKVLSILKIKEHEHNNLDLNLNLNKLVIYHMIIIVFGFIIIIHGAGNFLDFNYTTDTQTEYTTNTINNKSPNATKQEKVFVTKSKSKNINHLALIEIILGIILLTKATEFAKRTERTFNSKAGLPPEEKK